jgi:sugar transferase EpsL
VVNRAVHQRAARPGSPGPCADPEEGVRSPWNRIWPERRLAMGFGALRAPDGPVSGRRIKRVVDTVLAGAGLMITAPVLAGAFLGVRLTLGRPVLFHQTRLGRGEAKFRILKIRTMTSERDENGTLLPDHVRLRSLGRTLRRLSLDELPQLWNVLRGEMSLVGPRPLLPEYLQRYNERQKRRHDVRPGITGWAQVNGRNALSWEERLELDVWYVENWSPWLDMRIFWLTLVKVVRREGVSQEGHATMTEFLGTSGVTRQHE